MSTGLAGAPGRFALAGGMALALSACGKPDSAADDATASGVIFVTPEVIDFGRV